MVGIVLVLALVLTACLWVLWPKTIWQATTHTFDPERCIQGQCQELLRLAPAAGETFIILSDTQVDDPIAQWSDCLSSVAICIEQEQQDSAPAILNCVRTSRCPESCRTRFEQRAAGVEDTDQLWRLFEEDFVTRGARCVPEA
ncbi:MAG: hypothetical protein Kow0020_11400 [Wenzhouxiangellaceae bacterium]